ncbi:MAG: CoA-binding protein [Acidobacteriota bacterium]|nr:CoA-binding protein [Blastocatellia bacterium]MDW8411973.1 CoA-binding protein [Acidobacteriota bacterium]
MLENQDLQNIKQLLATSKTIAVVGMTPHVYKPSYFVPKYLRDNGYDIYPVNPRYEQIDGLTCYPNLSAVPVRIDICEVFRRSEEVLAHALEALQVKPRAFWMQSGIINLEAAKLLAEAGIQVIMDRCMYTDHFNLIARHNR